MDVLKYISSKLPYYCLSADPERDAALASMPLDSTCGDDCKAAIDAAAAFVDQIRKAHGH